MAEQETVKTTRLTFDYFKATDTNAARLVHTEVVEVFGVSHEDCFEVAEDGAKDLAPELAERIYPIIKHEKHCTKSDYHTVSWDESPRPAFWFEHPNDDEDGEE